MNFGFVIDNRSCIGCHACSTACKQENSVPLGVHRTWVKTVETGTFPDSRRSFQVTRCNHCANPPCVRICPTAAMFQRPDGIVEFDSDACIGCKACMQACPYDAIHLDPNTRTAAKCNFCAHRVDVGLEPACVVVCPEHAILAGDLDDPASEVARAVAKHQTVVRKPDQGTGPKLFYIDGLDLALHPTAVPRSTGFAAADVLHPGEPAPPQAQGLPAGGPIQAGGRMAAHLVAYDAQHHAPWHWPIPAYVITKHVAGGLFGWLALAALSVGVSAGTVAAFGGIAVLMTLLTLGLLIYDLDRPDRFYYLLVRPQWRSWVARAAWILAAFSVVSGGWWAAETAAYVGGFTLPSAVQGAFAVATAPFALLAAIYTAFLFAQAEGRDLWQSSHLPALMTAHAVALGALPLAIAGPLLGPAHWGAKLALIASAAITLVADRGTPHASEVARRANHAMTRGKWAGHFWLGGIGLGHVVPLAALITHTATGAVIATASAAVGLFLYHVALVDSAQEVPNS